MQKQTKNKQNNKKKRREWERGRRTNYMLVHIVNTAVHTFKKHRKNAANEIIIWQYLYTLSISKKINEICWKKHVPRALAALVFVW